MNIIMNIIISNNIYYNNNKYYYNNKYYNNKLDVYSHIKSKIQ